MENKTLPGYHPRIEVTQDFIERNNLTLPSQEHLLNLYKEMEDDTFFGFDLEVVRLHLDKDHILKAVKLKEGVDEQEFLDEWTYVDTVEEATQDFLDYMVFAWSKIMDEKGLSAGRSVIKLGAWLRVLGRDDLYEIISDDDLYLPYGAPAIEKVCHEMGIEFPNNIYQK